jgi:hypothetical protein
LKKADITWQKECERKPLLTLSAAGKLLPEGTLCVAVLGEPSILRLKARSEFRTKNLPSIRRVHGSKAQTPNGSKPNITTIMT